MVTEEVFLTPTFAFFPFQIVLIYFYHIIPSSSLLQAEVSYLKCPPMKDLLHGNISVALHSSFTGPTISFLG